MRWAWEHLAVIALLLSVVANTYLYSSTRDLAAENQNRIAEIQQSRVDSCRRTYEGVREIFRPFLQPGQTPQQAASWEKFNQSIDTLKAKCKAQTKPEEN